VTGACRNSVEAFNANPEPITELLVQVSRTGELSAATGSLRVTYEAGGRRAWMRVPFGIRLCAADDHLRDCE
jgi:hypothetical protein